MFLLLSGMQAHAQCDVGKERSVVQQPRLLIQPLHGHHCFGSGETVGQGTGDKSQNRKTNQTKVQQNSEVLSMFVE